MGFSNYRGEGSRTHIKVKQHSVYTWVSEEQKKAAWKLTRRNVHYFYPTSPAQVHHPIPLIVRYDPCEDLVCATCGDSTPLPNIPEYYPAAWQGSLLKRSTSRPHWSPQDCHPLSHKTSKLLAIIQSLSNKTRSKYNLGFNASSYWSLANNVCTTPSKSSHPFRGKVWLLVQPTPNLTRDMWLIGANRCNVQQCTDHTLTNFFCVATKGAVTCLVMRLSHHVKTHCNTSLMSTELSGGPCVLGGFMVNNVI